MPKIFSTILILMRVNAPVGYLLVFFPSLFGLFLAYQNIADLFYVIILFLGSIATRSAGCVINDMLDQQFDKKVDRTQNRPLANGSISNKDAFVTLFILLALALVLLVLLNFTSMLIGIAAFFMIILYPLVKRYSYFPQIFLGLTFNLGCLIGYSAICNNIDLVAILMYIACGFWTFGYDTIYAFMDIKDDKKIGVKSSAIFLEYKNYKFYIMSAYGCFLILYFIANILANNHIGAAAVFVALPILLWQIFTLDITITNNCLVRFKSNAYIGLILAIMMFYGN